MTLGPMLVAATRRAALHPVATTRSLAWILRNRKLRALLRVSAYAPPAARTWAARLVLRVARRLLRRDPVSPVGAPAKAVALQLLGREAQAVAFVEQVFHTAPEPARRRLGIYLAAIGRRPPRPPRPGRPASRALRASEIRARARALALEAESAWRSGRLVEARDATSSGLDLKPDDPKLRRLHDRVEGELRVLTPGWRPLLLDRPVTRAGGERGRVMHLLTNSLPFKQAGYTVRAQQIARSQQAVGLDPHMVTRAGFPTNEGITDAPHEESVDGVPYHRLAPDLPPGMRLDQLVELNVRAASELVERLRPAAVHPTTNHPNAQIALALRDRYGIPVIYEVRGFLEETWLSKMGPDALAADRYRLARETETACMRLADAVVTLSETMKREIVERGVDENKVTVIPNAVEIERFPVPRRNDALAASLGIEPGEVVLGYVSSFTEYEGIRYLIEAGAILRSRGRRVRVLLVGDGQERAALEARAQELELGDGVVFTGRVPHESVLDYYGLIDIFVVPRTSARVSQLVTPLKPYEAMATQRAMVVSRVAALLEIVREGETGLSFEPHDAEDLANVVEPLLSDPGERARLGAAAREWVVEHRTWRLNGERYRELYERLAVA